MDFRIICTSCNLTKYYIDHAVSFFNDIEAKILGKAFPCTECGIRSSMRVEKLKMNQGKVVRDKFPNKKTIITKQKLSDLINAPAVWRHSSDPIGPDIKEEKALKHKSDEIQKLRAEGPPPEENEEDID